MEGEQLAILETDLLGLIVEELEDGFLRVTDAEPGRIRRNRISECEFGDFLEEERDKAAQAIGLYCAVSFRRLRGMLEGDTQLSPAEERAFRYFKAYVLGEVA